MKPLLFALLLLLPTVALADYYQWRDAQGHVHFGDQPPANARDVKPIKSGASASKPEGIAPASDPERRQRTQKLLDAWQAEHKAAERDEERSRAATAESRQRCAALRDHLRYLEATPRLYRLDDKGERVFLSETEYVQHRRETELLIQQDCQPSP